jgi:hypothetical protein
MKKAEKIAIEEFDKLIDSIPFLIRFALIFEIPILIVFFIFGGICFFILYLFGCIPMVITAIISVIITIWFMMFWFEYASRWIHD